jgi:hypothetical protein
MVLRLEPQLAQSGAGYTQAIRDAEFRHGEVCRRFEAGHASREDVTAALRALEQLWLVEIARAKRVRRAAVGGTP